MNYENKKTLFKYIQTKDYKIKKDINKRDILYISFDSFNIKCKYFLLFTLIKEDKNNLLLWSCNNKYNTLETKNICESIKNKIDGNKKNINDESLNKMIKNIIKNFNIIKIEDQVYNLIWIIEDKKDNYSSFYIITELIYF